MSPTPEKKRTREQLEVEIHYLHQALSKLDRGSEEHVYLSTKLEEAEVELPNAARGGDDREGDNGGGRGDERGALPPSIPVGPLLTPPPASSGGNRYRDDPRHPAGSPFDHDDFRRYRDDPADHNRLFDDNPSYEPADAILGRVGDNHGNGDDRRHRLRDTVRGRARRLRPRMRPSSSATAGWTSRARKVGIAACVAAALLISIVCVVFFGIVMKDDDGAAGAASGMGEEAPHISDRPPSTTTTDANGVKFDGPCATFKLHLVPDQFGNETSWTIYQYPEITPRDKVMGSPESGREVLSGGPYSYKGYLDDAPVATPGDHYEMIYATACLPPGTYGFVLYDAKGDGMCCDFGRGEYGIKLSKNNRVIRPLSRGKFTGPKQVTPFNVGDDDVDVNGDAGLTNGNGAQGARPPPPPPGGAPFTRPEDLVATAEKPTEPCASFSMHLIPDQFGNETSWKVMRYDDVDMLELRQTHHFQSGVPVLEGGPYQYRPNFDKDGGASGMGSRYDMIRATTCLPVGVYAFILYDAKGDGMCCDFGRGEYSIDLSKGRVIRPLGSGKFEGAGEVTPFQVGGDDIDVLPDESEASAARPAGGDAAAVEGASTSSSLSTPSSDMGNGGGSSADEEPKGPCSSFLMHLIPDRFGNETSWEVVREIGDANMPTYMPTYMPTASPIGKRRLLRTEEARLQKKRSRRMLKWLPVLSGGPYSYQPDFDDSESGGVSHYNAIVAESCLPPGSYRFILYDDGEDGMCCDYGRGEYGISLGGDRVVRPLSAGRFKGPMEETPFVVGDNDVDVRPEQSSPAGQDDVSGQDCGSAAGCGPVIAPDDVLVDLPEEEPAQQMTSIDPVPVTPSIDSLHSLSTIDEGTSTTTAGLSKSYGILFDVTNTDPSLQLVISGMDLSLDTMKATHYEVWTKIGTWQDSHLDSTMDPDYLSGFKRVSHGSVEGAGSKELTKLLTGDFRDVAIPPMQNRAFYVTLNDDALLYKRSVSVGADHHHMAPGDVVLVQNDGVAVHYGAAVRAYPLELADPMTDFWNNAGFVGRLWYKRVMNGGP